MEKVVLLFTDSHLPIESYDGLVFSLCTKGFEVDVNELKPEHKEVHVISHGDADKRAMQFVQDTDIEVGNIIIAAPVHLLGNQVSEDTLILWSDSDKIYHNHLAAKEIYGHISNLPRTHIIGYPNVSFFLFGGIYYSQHHDLMDSKKEVVNDDVYFHIDDEVLNDIVTFLNEGKIKEKIVLSNENYLPCLNGVNVLCSLLKRELEGMGKKVYIATFRIKDHDYIQKDQERNIILIPGIYLPGGKKDQVFASYRPHLRTSELRPYGFDVLHLQNEFTLAKIMISLARKEKIPIVYTYHTMWDDMFYKRYRKPIARVVTNFSHALFFSAPIRNYNVMTVPTAKVKDYWTKRHVKKNIIVLPGCVDNSKFAYRNKDEEKIREIRTKYDIFGNRVMGYIGRISREKSIQDLVEYFERIAPEYPNLVFMIVGDGPFLNEFKEICKNSPYSSRLIVVGRVDNSDVKNYFRCFDFFCTASTFETQGLTYLESLLSGTLVLARKDPCLDNFIEDGVNSLLFTDFNSWKKGVKTLLFNKNKTDEMKRNAGITCHEYSKTTWARRFANIYEQATNMEKGLQGTLNVEEVRKIK